MNGSRVAADRHDEGTVTAFVVILTTALLACAGLVLDGGLALTARVRAVNLAQEAARAGGSEVLLIATGGGSKLGLAAVEAGEIDGSVCDRPEYQGRLAAKALYDAVTNPDAPKGQLVSYDTPKITKDTLAECPPEW